MVVSATGSSPLTRGKLITAQPVEQPARLIPAHAGKTTATLIRADDKTGSSPLTRGKP